MSARPRSHPLVLVASIALGACTATEGDDDPTAGDATSGDSSDSGDTGAPDPDADTDSATTATASGDGSSGDDPSACTGNAPTCFRDEPGTCAHVVDEAPATCDGREWSCPEGFALESDLQCTPEGDPLCIDGERCFVGGDCASEPYEPDCVNGQPACERGDALQCEWLCEPGDVPPDDCYDQGPGKCADFAPPPSCTDGVWTCPNGFDFGGYGEGCDFPG